MKIFKLYIVPTIAAIIASTSNLPIAAQSGVYRNCRFVNGQRIDCSGTYHGIGGIYNPSGDNVYAYFFNQGVKMDNRGWFNGYIGIYNPSTGYYENCDIRGGMRFGCSGPFNGYMPFAE